MMNGDVGVCVEVSEGGGWPFVLFSLFSFFNPAIHQEEEEAGIHQMVNG
jgi:hypothetical protein